MPSDEDAEAACSHDGEEPARTNDPDVAEEPKGPDDVSPSSDSMTKSAVDGLVSSMTSTGPAEMTGRGNYRAGTRVEPGRDYRVGNYRATATTTVPPTTTTTTTTSAT